jgi:nucleotide-binding universal stress UspA family protein
MPHPVIAAIDPRHQDVAPAALGAMLARLLDEPLILASAYPVDLGIDNLIPEYVDALKREAQRAVERVAGQLRPGPIAVATRAIEASASRAAALHDLAEREDASVLVLGSSRRGTVGRVMPSAVTDRLLHGAPCAVAIAPSGFSTARIATAPRAIAVAFTDTADGRAALAAADVLAGAARTREHVLVVAEPVPALVAGMLTAVEVDAARAGLAERAESTLQRALEASTHARAADGRILTGSVGRALAAASSDFDLLVCGSRGHGPLRTLVLGGTSHALVREASCPVLVVPRGVRLAKERGAQTQAA